MEPEVVIDPEPPDETGVVLLHKKKRRITSHVQGINAWKKNVNRANDDVIDLDPITEKIREKVRSVSQSVVLASWLLNMYVSDQCLQGNFDFPMSQTTCYSALACVSDTGNRGSASDGELVRETYKKYFSEINFAKPSGRRSNQLFAFCATDMKTGYNTYLEYGLEQIGIRYISRVHSVTADRAERLWKKLKFQILPAIDNEEMKGLTKKQRKTMASDIDLKDDKELFELILEEFEGCDTRIKILFEIASRSQAYNDDIMDEKLQIPVPRMFPERKIQDSFITVDKTVLKNWGIPEGVQSRIIRSSIPHKVLTSLEKNRGVKPFDIKSFSTDGTRVISCVEINEPKFIPLRDLYRRKEKLTTLPTRGAYYAEDFEHDLLKELEIEAFDPGQKVLFTGSKGTSMSLSEYRGIICDKKVKRRLENRMPVDIKQINTQKPSSKTINIERLVDYVKYHQKYWDVLWEEHGNKYYNRSRFQQCCRKQRAMDTITNHIMGNVAKRVRVNTEEKVTRKTVHKIVRTKNPVTPVMGSAVFTSSPKGLGPMPVVAVKEHAAKRCLLLFQDEYLTSQKCSDCKTLDNTDRMIHPKRYIGSTKCKGCNKKFWKQGDTVCGCGLERCFRMSEVYGIFTCKTCEKTWDRDINASSNIEEAFRGYVETGERPEYLRRPPKKTK